MNDFYNCPVCGKPSPSPVGCGCTIRDTIEWACQWVGWGFSKYLSGHGVIQDASGTTRSINDLAEAVRAKFAPMTEGQNGFQTSGAEAAVDWLESGPLAFIKAVREVIDNG